MTTQNEFNVEISDYGFKDAEQYFDDLWEKAIKINELGDRKKRLIEVLKQETLIMELTSFEAYVLVLKSYLETFEHKEIGTIIIQLLEKNEYRQYKYQLDAIKQAVAISRTIMACSLPMW